MTPELLLFIILLIVIIEFVFDWYIEYLNTTFWNDVLPGQLTSFYSADKYKQSQSYEKDNHTISKISSTLSLVISISVLYLGGFGYIDTYMGGFVSNPNLKCLLFFAVLGIAGSIISLPFSLYATFVIEAKYGFNKYTLKTFFIDKLKGTFLAILIGVPLVWFISYLYQQMGSNFWWITWAVVSSFGIIMAMFYTSWILPLFNKLEPLQEGELKNEIEKYLQKVGFNATGVYVMDGSKRSTKANAFFSGLGPKKKIVLFDTLIQKLNTEEIIAVLAHEVGHYKKKHILKSLVISNVQTAAIFYLFSLFSYSPTVYQALGAQGSSLQIDLIAFGILLGPINFALGALSNAFSRKNEFEADAFASSTYKSEALKTGLIKISVDSLSNLNPHPLYVKIHYSHPPLLERLKAIKASIL